MDDTSPRPTRRPLDAVPSVAASQAGVFTREQARAEGWSAHQICRRLRSGHWRRVAGRALAAAATPTTAPSLVWAVHLTWPDAVASHLTAARLHRFPVDDVADLLPAHAIVARPVRSLRDVRAHVLALAPRDVRRLRPDGPCVTGPRRTALDCLRTLDPEQALRLVPWLLTRKVLSRKDIVTAAQDGFGHWGTPQLVRLLRVTAGDAYSPAERRLHVLLGRAGLTGWTANTTVRDPLGIVGVVDVLFAAHKVVVEVDGWAAHSDPDAFQRDRTRQNRLVNAGYLVLRFTWEDLTHRPGTVVTRIREALSSRNN